VYLDVSIWYIDVSIWHLDVLISRLSIWYLHIEYLVTFY